MKHWCKTKTWLGWHFHLKHTQTFYLIQLIIQWIIWFSKSNCSLSRHEMAEKAYASSFICCFSDSFSNFRRENQANIFLCLPTLMYDKVALQNHPPPAPWRTICLVSRRADITFFYIIWSSIQFTVLFNSLFCLMWKWFQESRAGPEKFVYELFWRFWCCCTMLYICECHTHYLYSRFFSLSHKRSLNLFFV